MATETAAARTPRTDPYAPYKGLIQNAFKHNINTLLQAGPVASRTELHQRYTTAVGPISAGTFAEWLEEAGFSFQRTVNVVAPVEAQAAPSALTNA